MNRSNRTLLMHPFPREKWGNDPPPRFATQLHPCIDRTNWRS